MCQRHQTDIETIANKHWFSLYLIMKRARSDIVGTAAQVFGDIKSEYHLAEYAFPIKGPLLTGHVIDVNTSLRPHVTVDALILGLNGDLRKMTDVWKLFVNGCFSGKIRGVEKASPLTTTYSEHIGCETEALIRLELVKRFGQQGFQWQKSNDGANNLRYHAFKAMKVKVTIRRVIACMQLR
jgi:hypothetical protein